MEGCELNKKNNFAYLNNTELMNFHFVQASEINNKLLMLLGLVSNFFAEVFDLEKKGTAKNYEFYLLCREG